MEKLNIVLAVKDAHFQTSKAFGFLIRSKHNYIPFLAIFLSFLNYSNLYPYIGFALYGFILILKVFP